ncbi:hypothetical protein [Thermosipho atlanticus]|uniref:Uncharacterized protein n=1 Tax=Thermosipho atlanticus DSM 15807 TaxID=1123380 RepID=A0A1M5QYJ5_9BACT|nr:hypothetical protein [Thermosipho atlanticus]SHH19172.1 hypothetical protein SAMN02745199_0231 [Thermosipho atlanticus DSM 15807]
MKGWLIIFIITVLVIVGFFINLNLPKKIYLKGNSYIVSKFIDYLNKNGINFKLVDEKNARYVIDFNNLKVSLFNGLDFQVNWKDEDLKKCLEKFEEFNGCKILRKNNELNLSNVYFYEHFTFFLSCGINIIVSPSAIEGLENFVYQTFLKIIKGDYSDFENGFLVTDMYVYVLNDKLDLIGIYDPKLDVLNVVIEKNIQ